MMKPPTDSKQEPVHLAKQILSESVYDNPILWGNK